MKSKNGWVHNQIHSICTSTNVYSITVMCELRIITKTCETGRKYLKSKWKVLAK